MTHEWRDAFDWLSRADQGDELSPEDLERLARAAYMLGRDDDYRRGLERAHYGHLDVGDGSRAVRCAWWIGLSLWLRGEDAPASGWFARGERLLDREQQACVERGYLRLAHLLRHVAEADYDAAYAAAAEAIEIGERFGDSDLVAMGVMEQGHALLELGRTRDGLRLVDESMVAVTNGELSPIVAGIVYCYTIAVCQSAYELRRAREWTTALTEWCEGQPEMVAHQGVCLVHRAEIMRLLGAWEAALEEARRVGADLASQRVSAAALYVQGDLYRLRGEFEAAENALRLATGRGSDSQPGLALLRLAQGKDDAALAAIRRAVGETGEPLGRAALLPAYVEIALAAGEVEEAERASGELAAIAAVQRSEAFDATSAYAQGAVALARGEALGALTALRRSLQVWQGLEAPYEAARARVLVGLACAALGDDDGARLELEAARAVFEELGASPDLARVESLLATGSSDDAHGLSPRELQVLRLVTAGETNKAIAATLVLSERTIDRHVSNIYAKLGVSSRAAATAYAYEHRLV